MSGYGDESRNDNLFHFDAQIYRDFAPMGVRDVDAQRVHSERDAPQSAGSWQS